VYQAASDSGLLFTEEKKEHIPRQQVRWDIDTDLFRVNLFKRLTILTLLILAIFISEFNVIGKETGIQVIPVFDYITGRFNPATHADFVSLKKSGVPCSEDLYLRKETVEALKLMLDEFKKEHPKIKIQVQSAARNFYSQKTIWEEKWKGKRKVSGVKDITKITDPLTRSLKILEYSSMPGTSRHHWGTDFDINQLNNNYYDKGEGKIIYQWLTANAAKFGFAQPYTEGRPDGYKEEKWHWSYVTLSKKYLSEWNKIYRDDPSKFTNIGIFAGSDASGHLAPIFVNSINPACK
jgi:LAS superfamily LD-carboxypeptidase LdcB